MQHGIAGIASYNFIKAKIEGASHWHWMLAERHHGLAQRLSWLGKHLDTRNVVAILSLAHLNLIKYDQITIDLTSGWMVSCHVCRLGHWRFLSQVLLCAHPLSQSWTKKATGTWTSKDSRSFQNLNQQLQMTQMMEPFDQLPIRTKTTCHSLHVIYVISINFICLSPGKSAILLHPLNHVNPPIRRKMHHSKTSTEAPYTSAGRASVGRQHGPSKTGACKPILNKHDTQTWPLNQPTSEHKQTSFDLSLHQGNGGWKPCFSAQIIFKSILPKMLC